MVARKIQFDADMDRALVEGTAEGLGFRPLAEQIGVDVSVIKRRRQELGIGGAERRGRPPGRIEWHQRG